MLIHHILLTFRIFIYRPVLASLTDALSGLYDVGWISRLLFCTLKGTLAVSINWRKLLHIKLDIIHLKISFRCLSCDKTTSNSWSICYRL